MPNIAYLAVNGTYLVALAVWVGGMVAFAFLFAPTLVAALPREDAGRVVAAFLPRFRTTVLLCVVVLLVTSGLKFALWEMNLNPWLVARWAALAAMTGLAAYDFSVLAPRLAAAKAEGDGATFDRLHATASRTLGLTLGLGVVAVVLS
jgi:putative copper export protein